MVELTYHKYPDKSRTKRDRAVRDAPFETPSLPHASFETALRASSGRGEKRRSDEI